MRTAIALLVLLVVAKPAHGGGMPAWSVLGLGTPFVSALAADPTSPNRVYAGTGAGFYVSEDAGTTWTARQLRLPDPSQCPVQAIAFDPRRPSRVLIGLGIRLNSTGHCGAFQSSHRGRTWHTLRLPDEGVTAIAVLPVRPPSLLAGTTGDGSDVAGALLKHGQRPQWRAILTNADFDFDVVAVIVDPRDPRVIYVATNNYGVVKSIDGGGSWTPVNEGLPRLGFDGQPAVDGPFIPAFTLTIDPHDPDTLYTSVLGQGSCCPDLVGGNLFTSHDGGATWTGSTSGLADLNVLAVAVDPVALGVLYAGTTNGVFRSGDGGVSWTPLGTGLPLHVTALSVDAEAHDLFAGTGGGVWKLALQ
jgi:hypothetical protein